MQAKKYAEKENNSKLPSANKTWIWKMSLRDSADHPKDTADSFSHALVT